MNKLLTRSIFIFLLFYSHSNAQDCDIDQYDILEMKYKEGPKTDELVSQLICISKRKNANDLVIYWQSKREFVANKANKFSDTNRYLQETEQSIKSFKSSSNEETIHSLFGYFEHQRNLVSYYYSIGAYEEAEQKATLAANELENTNLEKYVSAKNTILYNLYNFLMKINAKAGRLDEAKYFFDKAEKKRTKKNRQWYRKLFADHSKEAENYDEALEVYETIYESYKDEYENSIPVSVAISECYRNLNEEDNALKVLNSAVENPNKLKDLDLEYGKVHSHFNKPQLASYYLKKALAASIDTWGYNHHEVAATYNALGVHYKKYNQLDSASFYFKHGLSALSEFEYSEQPQFNIQFFIEKNFPKGFVQKRMFIDLLSQEGTLLYEQALTKQVEKKSLLEKSLKHFNHSSTLIDKIRQSYISDYDKQVLLNNSYGIYETAIEVCYQLNKLGDVNYKEQALVFSEKSKSIRLFDAFKNSRALRLGNVPDNILQEEEELREDILALETELNNQKIQKKELLGQLTSKRVIFQDFIKQMEKDYPSYYKEKYATPTISLENIQERLSNAQSWKEWFWGENKTGLIEYFLGEEVLYTFLITPSKVKLIKQDIKKENFSALVEQYLVDIKNWQGGDSNHEKKYESSAAQLYKILFSPIEATIKQDNIENITVIPDGAIHYIPFSALKKQPNSSFLLQTYCFAYAHSITLSEELNQSNSTSTKVLAIAPTFPNPSIVIRNERLNSSANNVIEVENIKKIIPSTRIVKGTEATKETFKKYYGNYSIIHLATHAVANMNNPHLSFISFTQNENATESEIEKELLNLGEIYGLALNSEMVVLSACETGTGKMDGREGSLSFSRAFTSAGAKSVISTLWSTRTDNLKQITTTFYEMLKIEENNKAKALQQAKLQFIEDQGYESPYHWASLIPYGNMRTIELN